MFRFPIPHKKAPPQQPQSAPFINAPLTERCEWDERYAVWRAVNRANRAKNRREALARYLGAADNQEASTMAEALAQALRILKAAQ